MHKLEDLDGQGFDQLRPRICAETVVRRYENDIVAWSPSGRHPLAIEGVSAVVFDILDGAASVAELITDIHEVVGVERTAARRKLREVLGQFAGAGLLADVVGSATAPTHEDFFPAPPNP